jgi:hypothetical protein
MMSLPLSDKTKKLRWQRHPVRVWYHISGSFHTNKLSLPQRAAGNQDRQ